MDYCTGFETRRMLKSSVGPNPTPTLKEREYDENTFHQWSFGSDGG